MRFCKFMVLAVLWLWPTSVMGQWVPQGQVVRPVVYQPVIRSATPVGSRTHSATSVKPIMPTALTEVNAARAARGLPAYIEDGNLTMAAQGAASYRATHLIRGHTSNDFGFLPRGTSASAAGCGALEPSWGWGSCCTYDRYRYAGAAVVTGRDGRRYMHLFVR